MIRKTTAEHQTSVEDEKRARLAAALRENLKRRKAQGRARREDEAQTHQPTQADPSRS